MKFRKIISLTALLSFSLLFLTGIVLYILPHGRIAYWNNWHLWGLTKDQWSALHINLGAFFVLSICFHVYLNLNAIINYLKGKTKNLLTFSRELCIALVLVAAISIGTIVQIPPFSSLVNLSELIKTEVSKSYSEPPYGHAELSSLEVLCRRLHIDSNIALYRLKSAGLAVKDSGQRIKEIALANRLNPAHIFNIIVSPGPNVTNQLPDNPYPGLGRLALIEFCEKYGLKLKVIAQGLVEKHISFDNGMTLKQIAKKNNMTVRDIYFIIKDILK